MIVTPPAVSNSQLKPCKLQFRLKLYNAACLHLRLPEIHYSIVCFRKRIGVEANRRDPVADQIISTLNLQNETMRKNMAKMEMKVDHLLGIVNDIQSKISKNDQ